MNIPIISNFKNLSIKVKMLLIFFLIISILFIVGGIGYLNIDKVGNISIEIVNEDIVELLEYYELKGLIEQYRTNVVIHVGEPDTEKLLEIEKKTEELGNKIQENINKDISEDKIHSHVEENIDLIAKFEEAWRKYVVLTKNIFEQSRGYMKEDALALTLQEGMTLYNNSLHLLDKIIENINDETKSDAFIAGNTMNTSKTNILIIGAAGIFISIIISLLFAGSISGPIKLVVDSANKIASGNIELKTLNINSKDEIGMLARSFSRMTESLRDKVRLIEKIAQGAGDFTIDVAILSENDFFGKSLEKMLVSLNDILIKVRTIAGQVATGSDQVSKSSQSLSQGASEQAGSLEEVSSSINEIANQAKQNAENAIQANTLAKKATENAENGNSRMKDLVASMQKINESSDAIKKIVKMIDDIAFQINLLALNANVEAARAGKYGKGFAVVAEEVRNLAVKSANSVKETTEMVEESIKNIELGNQAADATAKQLEEIVAGASRVADLVEEISLASKEQSEGIEQINTGLDQIDQVTQSNTANAEESASAAEELASQAQQLKSLIAQFKLAENGHRKMTKDIQFQIPDELLHKLVQEEIKKIKEEEAGHRKGNGNKTTGVTIVKEDRMKPEDVISLDDDNYGKF